MWDMIVEKERGEDKGYEKDVSFMPVSRRGDSVQGS